VVFGEELKRIRERKGLTVNQLAIYSGVSAASISRYETGSRSTPKPPTIKKLATGLKMDYKELMKIAGYVEQVKGEGEYTPAENEYERLLRETEEKYNVNLRDDPVALKLYQELLVGIAKTKIDKK